MRFLELTTRGFRNLRPDAVSFGPGWNLIVGENGQGKSNLLEAAALVCGQRSFRRARADEMAADGEGFEVTGTVRRGFATEELSVRWSRGDGRSYARAGKTVGFRDLSACAPAVFLAPEHHAIIAGPAQERRRFLDRLVLGCRPAAGGDLVSYGRALKERNALLAAIKDDRGGLERSGELEAWTEELARTGDAVRRHRREALELWQKDLSERLSASGKEYAAVSISYSAGEVSDLKRTLEKLLPAERARGRSLAGPHKDDLVFTRGGLPLQGRASAGEIHRLVTLAKLAEWRVVRDASGEAPLFGVDDFDAGLSERSLEGFLAGLPEGATVLLTSASDPARFRGVTATTLRLNEGRCRAEGSRAAVGI